jgi:hypothetical protein
MPEKWNGNMKTLLTALAFAIASVCAFGSENPDYHLKVIALTGQTIAFWTLGELGNPAINNRGDVIFNGYASVPQFFTNPQFVGVFSTERVVAPYSGFLLQCLGPYVLNDAGQIAFVQDSKIDPTHVAVPGVYESNLAGGPVETIAAPGVVVDGVQLLGGICSNSTGITSGFSFNNSGRIAFVDTGGLYTFTPEKGLVKSNITKVDGHTVTSLFPVGGSSEELLFQASTSTFQGIFTPYRLLVKTGQRIDGLKLAEIIGPVASGNGRLAFLGSFGAQAPGENAIFTQDSVIARGGEWISGRRISTAGQPFTSWAVNNRGEVIMEALFGAGTYPNDLAIFSSDAVIVAVGDSIDGRTVVSLGAPALNDFGKIAFLATFSDGSQGIIEATPRWRR